MILTLIPPISEIRWQVRARGQGRILGELTPWKMGCCFAWNIIRIMTISAFQSIVMSEDFFFLIQALTFFWADPPNMFFPSCHCQTPRHRSEGPMATRTCALPSPASRIPRDALLVIHLKGYEGQRGWLWIGWRWWRLWGAFRTKGNPKRASENLAWWFVVGQGDYFLIGLYGGKQRQYRDVDWFLFLNSIFACTLDFILAMYWVPCLPTLVYLSTIVGVGANLFCTVAATAPCTRSTTMSTRPPLPLRGNAVGYAERSDRMCFENEAVGGNHVCAIRPMACRASGHLLNYQTSQTLDSIQV